MTRPYNGNGMVSFFHTEMAQFVEMEAGDNAGRRRAPRPKGVYRNFFLIRKKKFSIFYAYGDTAFLPLTLRGKKAVT